MVVVEERGLRRVALVGEPVLRCHLLERWDAVLVEPLVDVQLVRARLARDEAGVADVDVEQSIAIDVGHGYSSGPGSFAANTGFVGDVPELKVALVDVELIPVQVRGEHHLGQAIPIEVAYRHAAAVVEIAVGEDVHLGRVFDAIDESDPRVARGHHRE